MGTLGLSVKKFLHDYLYFSKRDRTGILAILVIIMLVYFLPEFFPSGKQDFEVQQGSLLAVAIDTLEAHEKRSDEQTISKYNPKHPEEIRTSHLFQFDPNVLDADGWKKLGLNERLISTIIRYRTKGGHFYKAEDLKKIWGLPEEFYNRVKDFIVIPEVKKNFADTTHFTRSYTQQKISNISINDADTAAFIALPGIGSKLAQRIILYREKIGGFYSVDQLSEIYGLKDSTFQIIRPYLQISGNVKKFKINSVTREELKMHPYFKWNLANAIVSYREQHGSFKSLEELKNISLIDQKTFEKIVHYLEL